MPELGRLTAVFDADTRRFDAGIKSASAKVIAFDNNIRGLTGGVTSAAGAISGLASPLALAAGGAVILASAVGSAAVGLFELTKAAAKTGGELFDLSQKTSFTVETLSGLSIIAKTTGSDINSISSSLIIFQKNMGAAQDATSKQGELFKSLNIDTRDNEKALRQAFTALAKYGDTQKGVEVATKLFGRSGAAVLAMIKETNGNLDEAIERYDKLGLIIKTSAAAQSDRFNDLLEETTLQLEAVTRTIGQELLPVAIDALQHISFNLQQNKEAWADWGKTVANVLQGVKVAVNSQIGQMIFKITEFSLKYLSGAGLLIQGLNALGSANPPPGEDPFGPGGAARGGRGALPGTPEWKALQKRAADMAASMTKSGGGGGGGASRADTAKQIAEMQLDAVVSGLRSEQDANRRALELRRQDFNTYADEYMKIENKRHKAVIDALNAEEKATSKSDRVAMLDIANRRIEENATHEQNRNRVLDERGKIVDRINDFLRDQERQIDGLTSATSQWDDAYQQLVDTLKEEGVELEANTKKRIEQNIALAKEKELILSVTRARQVMQTSRERMATREGRERPPWIDLGGGSTVGGEPGTTTRPRIATVERQVMEERMQILRDQMRNLSFELTDIIAFSVEDGFQRGWKGALDTFQQGLIRVVQNAFLGRIQKGLEDILTNIGGGGGSNGGFWGGLLSAVLGGVVGGFGGGKGSTGGAGTAAAGVFAGAFASGGTIPMGQWGVVHDNERVFATPQGAQVVPGAGSSNQNVVNNYIIQLPQTSKGGYVSPKSARQQAEMILAHIQGSQT